MRDSETKKLIREEEKRQLETINLIASENYVSRDVREALASVFTNKYAEGYPKKRYYEGNEIADKLESLVQKRALLLFRAPSSKWDVNVQAYSGSPANLAVLHALLEPGDRILSMSLDAGGHLTHGHPASITGKLWERVPYGVDRLSERIDYGEILNIARLRRPSLIIAGGSAYSRIIDFGKFRAIADEVKATLMADISHIAGLVAAGIHPSPFPHADVVTTTTHKTLRGPRAAIIFSKKEFSESIRKTVFPGLQGGPHLNAIAGVGVALDETRRPDFKKYAARVVKNASVLAEELSKKGWRIVSGGTDTHLFLIDTMDRGISGGRASAILARAGVIVNKNAIPFDIRSPKDPSGIRVGTPAVTTRGMKEKEMKIIARIISSVFLGKTSHKKLRNEVLALSKKFALRI